MAEHVSRRTAPVAATAATAAALVLGAVPADVGATEELEHCIIEVIGIEETGEFITAPPQCFASLGESLRAQGVDVPASRTELSMDDVIGEDLLAAASFTLAVHYNFANLTGASISITGTDCGGGYLNLDAGWIDRITSTYNACTNVTFYDGYDKSGTPESTGWGSHNLAGLNNAANSVSYGS